MQPLLRRPHQFIRAIAELGDPTLELSAHFLGEFALAREHPKVPAFRLTHDAPFIVLAAFEHPIIRPERPEEAHLELAFARFTRRTRTPLRHTLLAVGFI